MGTNEPTDPTVPEDAHLDAAAQMLIDHGADSAAPHVLGRIAAHEAAGDASAVRHWRLVLRVLEVSGYA